MERTLILVKPDAMQRGLAGEIISRLERRGLIAGRWVEKAGQRRRRYYRLTTAGRKMLGERRKTWSAFMLAIQQAAGLGHA